MDVLRRVRRNHAVEHATIAVLMERGARPPLAGYSLPAGYLLYGSVTTQAASAAASEAVDRLRSGESEMAISPYCGTNLVVGAAIAGLFSALVLYPAGRRIRHLPLVAAGSLLAALAGRPIGQEAQRRYTTLPDVGSLEIAGVHRFELGGHTIHWIGTG